MFLWFALYIACALQIMLAVYFLGELGDVESDFVNPVTFCKKASTWIKYKLYFIYAIGGLSLLLGDIISLLLVPIGFFVHGRMTSDEYKFESTELYKRTELKRHRRNSMIDLGVSGTVFFIALLRGIYLVVS